MKQFTKWISNKYLLSSVFFILWISFFDKFNVFQILKRKQELSQLKENKLFYKQEIEKTKIELLNLRENSSNLEKVAREKYLMKKENEDLFTIEK